MGQQQSSEKDGKSERTSRNSTPYTEKEKKVGRRTSIQVLTGRASPADPSASNASATAQAIPQQGFKSALQHHLQSASPELSSKGGKVERSTSRGSSASKQRDAEKQARDVAAVTTHSPSGPMNVPTVAKSKQDDYEDPAAFHHRHYTPVSQLRPPRLPLPIADIAIPESPTLQPVDRGNEDVSVFEEKGVAMFDEEEPLSAIEPTHRRRGSITSTTTVDDEDIGDELQPYAVETSGQTVPTVLEWNDSGESVYVTGSFASWEKKFKLHKKKGGHGWAATISLPPGTHHLIFFIDGKNPRTSTQMPTTVDLNNFLVNYIEISPDQTGRSRRESSQRPDKKLVFPPHPPLLPEELDEYNSGEDTPNEYDGPESPQEEEVPFCDFRQIIPQALVDMDLPEEDPRYQQAARIIQDANGPPALPLFLGKSILNGSLPLKDDASVLTLPNHTVLNHLATSSVRNGVLATSVTTRYKKKVRWLAVTPENLLTCLTYVTTIMYKPVPRHE